MSFSFFVRFGAVLLAIVYSFGACPDAAADGDDGVSPEVRQFVDDFLEGEKSRLGRQGFGVDVNAVVDVTDFNGDGYTDLVLQFTSMSHCGSGGCERIFFKGDAKSVTPNGPARWHEVFRYVGGNYALQASLTDGHRDIRRIAFLSGGTVFERATWQGGRYGVSFYEDRGVRLRPERGVFRAKRDLSIHDSPKGTAPELGIILAGDDVRPIAATEARDWYLVLVATGRAGYVSADQLTRQGP